MRNKILQLIAAACFSLGGFIIGTNTKGQVAVVDKKETVPPVVRLLRESWGDGAEIYWNESGCAVIAKDGYVSEFEIATGTTRHFGHINR